MPTLDNVTLSATGTLQNIVNAIDKSDCIPVDAKQAIKDFLRENFESMKEQASDLLSFPVPDSIIEYWPIVVEISQSFLTLIQ